MRITELDIETDGIYMSDEPTREDWEYWLEVKDCCGGTDWTCCHYRYYPDLDDRFTYRED